MSDMSGDGSSTRGAGVGGRTAPTPIRGESDVEAFGPREFLLTLRRRRRYVVVTALITFATAAFYVVQRTPVYRSTAEVLVAPPAGSEADLNLETEASLATSPEVASKAAERLQRFEPPPDLLAGLAVDVLGQTEILVFVYSDPDPEVASSRAQALAEGYLDFRQEAYVDEQISTSTDLQQRIDRLREDLAEITEQLEDARSEDADLLNAQAGVLNSQIFFLTERLIDTVGDPYVGRIVQPASAAQRDDNRLVLLFLALLVGLALGAGVALLVERLDDTLRGREDLEDRVGAPVLAVIPRATDRRRRDRAFLATVAAPESPMSEAFRTLRTGILFTATTRPVQTILVTSSRGAEGKTTTVANLAIVLGKAGKRVIAVSADLRRPQLEACFGLAGELHFGRGLTNVLAREIDVDDVLVRIPGNANVRLLPSGPLPGNPAEVLESHAMERVIARLRDQADFILLDSARLLGVSDALVLCRLADGVLFIANAATTRRTIVNQARAQLGHVDAAVVGAVLNDVDPRLSDTFAETYRSREPASPRA